MRPLSVHPDRGEVGAESPLHLLPDLIGQGSTGTAGHLDAGLDLRRHPAVGGLRGFITRRPCTTMGLIRLPLQWAG